MMKQQILYAHDAYKELDELLLETHQKKLMLVCGNSINYLNIGKYFDALEGRLGIKVIRFSSFKPNPLYESAVEGVDLLKSEKCQLIVAVGGGSAMDVAKCIKLFSGMDISQNCLEQSPVPNDITLLAVPTTAGTGSESTRHAVIYYNGEKQSVSDDSIIPSTVLFDASSLKSLPDYQRKATMMDALCHATESFWSVNSTEESRKYSTDAINLVFDNLENYLANTETGNEGMLKAANIAGKAINITQTTAGHAMCYKLCSLYGISHGHAAALCVSKLFPYMIEHTDRCIDPRGEKYLLKMFDCLAEAYGCSNPKKAAEKFNLVLSSLELSVPTPSDGDYDILKTSVNPIRLKNNPVELDINTIDYLYHQILTS